MLDPPTVRRAKRLRLAALLGAAGLVAAALATRGLGDSAPAWAGPLGLAYTLTAAGGAAALYAGAGVGYALLLAGPLLRRSHHRWWLLLALGPALMFFLSHALGTLGLLGGSTGRAVALGTVLAGLLALAFGLIATFRASPNIPTPPWGGLLLAPPAGLLAIAAANPPGWLWASEGRNYDSLSYHLQLAQEWARNGRIAPLEHNVYSYLPSYVEAGFTHLAVIAGAGTHGRGGPTGLLAFDGLGAIATQYLHALTALLAAVLVARVTWAVVRPIGLGERAARLAACVAGAALLAVPWVLVVSSLSYNESAVNLLFAAALLAAMDHGMPAGRRGLLTGLLVGLAVGCKPTAAFFLTAPVGLMLLTHLEHRLWAKAVVWGTVGGVLAVAPFLVRNALAGGNPVFPAGTSLFGPAHWTSEQVARFTLGHREAAPLPERAMMLVGFTGTGLGQTARGMFHPQWGLLFPAGLAALAVATLWRAAAGAVTVLWAGVLVGLAWWLMGSHAQSRFLLPLAVPLALGLGLACARLVDLTRTLAWPGVARLGVGATVAAPLLLAATSVRIFLSESGGMPNLLLLDGGAARTGESLKRLITSPDPRTRDDALNAAGPEAFVNLSIDPTATVYLLGDATPFYYTRPVRYHTTWDRAPLGEAIRRFGDDPEAWAMALRRDKIDYVMVNFMELERLRASGWADPDVTRERVERLLQVAGEPVRQWPASGQILFRLRRPRGASELSA